MLIMDMLKDVKNFTELELSIVRFICDKPKEVTDATVEDLALLTYSSPSSIVRLCKKLGFKGFTDFKIKLAIEINTFVINQERIEVDMPITKSATQEEMAKTFLNLHYQALMDSYHGLDLKSVQAAADVIYNSDCVNLRGMGPSLLYVEDFHYKLRKLGIVCSIESLTGFEQP